MHLEPPVSDPLHSVNAVIYGAEPCISRPSGYIVTRNGSTIGVDVVYAGSVCLSVVVTWRDIVPLGTLPAGVYDVVVTSTVFGRTNTLRQTLIVRATGAVRFDRVAVPIGGGRLEVSDTDVCFSPCATSISFDGGPSVPIDHGFVDVPPHAAGTVDLSIGMYNGSRQAMKAAITYYDPDAPPDLALFEPILFPIAYDGGGAFGSQWTTENALEAIHGAAYRSTPDLGASRPEGILLWGLRGTVDDVDAQSRIREVTRNDMGIEVPVVRERDFRRPPADFDGRGLRILRVPVRPNARYTLRVYALGDPGIVTLRPGKEVALSQSNTDGLWFTAVDVTQAIASSTAASVTLGVTGGVGHDVPYWAMVSITDNATQQVTIVTPQ